MPKTDFHMHSSCSDGLWSAGQLLECIIREGVTHFSLTDHDTVAGIPQLEALLSDHTELQFLPGAELSAGRNGRIHLLIYGQVLHPELLRMTEELADARRKRLGQMMERLAAQGLPFPEEAAGRLLAGCPGRLNLAREMVALGYAPDTKQAISRYLLEGRCGFVPFDLPPAGECLRKLSSLPVVPVLAHPMKLGLGGLNGVFSFIESLIPLGLRGVECFHPSANARQSRALEGFARSHGLLVTGGSDTHGDSRAMPGDTGSVWSRSEEDAQALFMEALRMRADKAYRE